MSYFVCLLARGVNSRNCPKSYMIFRKETVPKRPDANLIVTLCNG